MPDFLAYHRSLTNEIYSLKNRIRDLVPHWGTDGEYKEVALRNILRRHVPESTLVGRGFVVIPYSTSTQIDVLIVDRDKPTLFKDGDLIFVTPDAVRAIIEVKTALEGPQAMTEALTKLAENEKRCREVKSINEIWTGLFVYEGNPSRQESLLRSIAQAYQTTGLPVNCVSYGKEIFVRYWKSGNEVDSDEKGPVWHSYNLKDVAPAYFIGNLVDSISSVDRETSSFAWFPILEGKETRRQFYLPQGEKDPKRFK
ncbi:hypothetical protein L0244_22490 [bacterium]|nr:hypothetical protein [bacterium]